MYLDEPIKLTIDIDGVLVNNFVIWKDYFNSQAIAHNHNLITCSDSPCWDFFHDICKKCWNHVLHDLSIVGNYKLVDGALDVLSFLKFLGFDLTILTSRPKDVKDETIAWCSRELGLLITEVIVSDDKVGVASSLGAKYHVDDAPKHIIPMAESPVKCIIWDHPYNVNYAGPRVSSWPQYGAYLLWDIHKDK